MKTIKIIVTKDVTEEVRTWTMEDERLEQNDWNEVIKTMLK